MERAEGTIPGSTGVSEAQTAERLAEIFSQQPEEAPTDDEALVEDNLEDQETDVELETEEYEEEAEEDPEVESEDSEEEVDPEGDYFEIEGERYSAEDLIEFKNSGLRQADYTKKTQEVAEQRKEVASQLEQYTEYNKQYAEHLEQQQQVLAAQMYMDNQTEEALAQLRNEDFDEYLRVKDQVDQRRQQMQGYFQQIQQAKEQAEQAEAAVRAQRIEEAYQTISQSIPDYTDPEKGPEIRAGVSKELEQFGFTADDLNAIDDPRMFMVAHALYEARKGDSPEVKKAIAKKKAAKKVAPVLRGGQQKTKSQRQAKKVQNLKSRQAQSGSIEDTEILFRELFK